MEVTKIVSVHFLIAIVFTAHGCISQHWSHGWLPGGKRNAVSMDAYLEMVNDEDIITDFEIPKYQYLYQKMNSPPAYITSAIGNFRKRGSSNQTCSKILTDNLSQLPIYLKTYFVAEKICSIF
ncbi:gonadotropin-releasing hormone 3 isoform X1 [Scyliorhinus canicula]|uniref:gonadotropin-releasing hormone 3 isoform X1 n=1 Tax=Scyliorhinus canicula TaxID=7830 RepID=UPI0018F3EB7A|nr:gonadotropin-releasing hormone 3 isoform X1 [Scyliorhinus canicula]